MEILLILIAIAIFWWVKTGRKDNKLYREIEHELVSEYGWSSDQAFHIWKRFNKEIVNMQLDGLSSQEIAKNLAEKFPKMNQ